MNPYPSPSSITMQRGGDKPVTITLEDAVVIMTNQQKTIEELIANNQRMFQYIQDAQKSGSGFGNIQFAQQNLTDPASHVYGGGAASTGGGAQPVREKPMTLNEYLALKKGSAAAAPAPAPAPVQPDKPMTLSEFLAQKKAATTADDVPIFDTPSKTEPVLVSTDL